MVPLGGQEGLERWEDTALGADHLSFRGLWGRASRGGAPTDKVTGKHENPAHFPGFLHYELISICTGRPIKNY